MKMEFFIEQRAYHKHLDLFVCRRAASRFWIAKPVEFVEIPEDEVAPSTSAIHLTHTDAQALMDELYRAGIRPTRSSNSEGALTATQHHLKDMRTIAFGLIANEVQQAQAFREHGLTAANKGGE